MPENYYHILGLDSSTSKAEIKATFRKLAKKYHPDKNLNDPSLEVKFKRINKQVIPVVKRHCFHA